MDKERFRTQILDRLQTDYPQFLHTVKNSHAIGAHADKVPDSKDQTLAQEASYIAQGQAKRAQEIKQAIEDLRQMVMQTFTEQTSIRISYLVQLEDEISHERWVFIGSAAGGLKLEHGEKEVMLITPPTRHSDRN